MSSLRQHVMLFLMERRLNIDEAATVVKILETDSKLKYLEGRWDRPAENFVAPVLDSVTIIARGKVIAWMNRYRPDHSARALFTGDS